MPNKPKDSTSGMSAKISNYLENSTDRDRWKPIQAAGTV